jgi:hypothetical protein
MTTSKSTLLGIRRRPVGIYIVCLLLLLIALVNGWDVYQVVKGLPSFQYPALASRNLLFGVDSAKVIVAVFCIAGLLAGRQWAWHLTMILLGVGLLMNIWGYFSGRVPYVGMALQSLAVLYLNLRSVQDFFKRPEPELAERVQ